MYARPASWPRLQGVPADNDSTAIESAHSAALRAARLAPHDARAWLILATIASALNHPNREIAGPLKMSYLTGPGEVPLSALRLRVATRSGVIEDEELQNLVTQDVRTLVIRRPELAPEIISIYRGASAEGQRFLLAGRQDPGSDPVSDADPSPIGKEGGFRIFVRRSWMCSLCGPFSPREQRLQKVSAPSRRGWFLPYWHGVRIAAGWRILRFQNVWRVYTNTQ